MTEFDLLRVVLSLLAIIGMLLTAAWLMRRVQGIRRPNGRRITILDAQALGPPRTHIAVVRVDETTLVLGITPQQVNLLHTLPTTDDAEPAAANAPSFSAALAKTFARTRS